MRPLCCSQELCSKGQGAPRATGPHFCTSMRLEELHQHQRVTWAQASDSGEETRVAGVGDAAGVPTPSQEQPTCSLPKPEQAPAVLEVALRTVPPSCKLIKHDSPCRNCPSRSLNWESSCKVSAGLETDPANPGRLHLPRSSVAGGSNKLLGCGALSLRHKLLVCAPALAETD